MTRIATKATHTLADVKDKATMFLPIANRFVVDGNNLGIPQSVTYDMLERSLVYQFYTQVSHGLTADDVGKPLFGSSIYNDTSTTTFPTSVLAHVTDANTLLIALPGARVTIPVSLVEGGAAYNIAASGRLLWWDFSAQNVGRYKPSRPVDAQKGGPPILYILRIVGGNVEAQVRPLVTQPMRLLSEYTLTAADIAARYCNFTTSSTAIDGILFLDGICLSSVDVDVSWSAGTMSWNTKSLDGRAEEGMILKGLYEPKI
jgi:hypothetical protein